MKSGTSSLHHYLNQHPQVYMSSLKEPAFFTRTQIGPRDVAWYLKLFEEAQDEPVVGESSTHYSKLPTYQRVPERDRRGFARREVHLFDA